MIGSAVKLIAEKVAFSQGPRTRASLGRVTQDIHGTEWEPRWTYASPSKQSPELLTARHSARVHTDDQSDEPYVSVYWETERSFNIGLQEALIAARFNTSCCPSLPQHICYTWDNVLYLMNYLKAACPALFEVDLNEAIITLSATILANVTINPLPNILPDDPVSVIVIATANEISCYGVYPDDETAVHDKEARIQICLVNQPSKIEDSADQFTHEIITLRISQIPKYSVSTGGRIVREMVGDAQGRILVCFEDDGLGVHEVVYRSRGSLLHGPLMIRRLVKPNGSVCSRRMGESDSVPGAVFSALGSAFSEAQMAVSRMILPQTPELETSHTRFLLAHEEGLFVTIDNHSVTRVYVKQSTDKQSDSPVVNRKRRVPLTAKGTSPIIRDTPMLSSSPPRKRRLDNGEAQGVTGDCDNSLTSSSCGAFRLASEFTLPFLACQFFQSTHFDARFLSAQGLGLIAEATLNSSLSPGVSVLTLTTSSARKIELALDCSSGEGHFEFGLLGVHSIDLPSDLLQSELPSPSLEQQTPPATMIHQVAHQVKHSFTKSWKKGPIFICTCTRAIENHIPELITESPILPYKPSHTNSHHQVNIITLGLHPSVAPLSMCRAPQNDGYMTFETSEPVRMVIDADTGWVSSLDFRAESRASRLPDGSGLLNIGLENCLLRVGAQDALLRGGSSMSRNAPRTQNPFHRTFWVFHDTFFRKLHIKWGGLDRLPPVNSLPLNLLDDLDAMSTPNVPNFPRVLLHPDDGTMEQPEVLTWRSAELRAIAPVIPSPSVDALSDLLSQVFAEILQQPLFVRDTHTDRLIVTWTNFHQVWLMCRNLVKLLETHKSNLIPSVLSSTKEAADIALTKSSENTWIPLGGKGQVEAICNQESKRALIFVDQRRQLSGLAAFVNIMSQVGTVVNTLQIVCDSWLSWNVNGQSLWTTLETAMGKSGQTLFPRLLSEPLANLLSDKRSLLPLTQLTQALLELLTQLSVIQSDMSPRNDVRTEAMSQIRIIVRNCGWLMSDNAFHVALRQRLSQVSSLSDPAERASAVVRVCLQLLPQSDSGQSDLIEASTLREKCQVIRAVLNTLVMETGAIDTAVTLIAHLASTQPPDDRETYLDELHVCIQRLLKRLVEQSFDFIPTVTQLSQAFAQLHPRRTETDDLETSIGNISVNDTRHTPIQRSATSIQTTDLYSTSAARAKVRRTLVQAIISQIYEQTRASVLDGSQKGLARLFIMSPSLLTSSSPETATDMILIKFCQSILDGHPIRESDQTLHLKVSAELLRCSTPSFDSELLKILSSSNLQARLSAMTALMYGFSYDVSGRERSSEMAKVLLSQLPEISRHPWVSSAWFCEMAGRCLHLNESLSTGRLPPEGETALDTLVETQCLGNGLTIADGNRIWVTVHKRWAQLISKHQYCVVPLLEWIEAVLAVLSVPIPSYGTEDSQKSSTFFSRSETRVCFKHTDIVPLSDSAADLLTQEGRCRLQGAFEDLVAQAIDETHTERGLTERMRRRLLDLYSLTASAASYLSVGELLTIIYPAGALHLAARCLVVTWEPTLDRANHAMVAVMISEFGQVLMVSGLSPMRGLAKLTGWRNLMRATKVPDFLDGDDAIAMNVYATLQMVLVPNGTKNMIAEILRDDLRQLTPFFKYIGLAWLHSHRKDTFEAIMRKRKWLQDIITNTIQGELLLDYTDTHHVAKDALLSLVEDESLRDIAEDRDKVDTIWNFISSRQEVDRMRASEVLKIVSS